MTEQNNIERSNNLIELARGECSEKIITDMEQLDQEISRILEESGHDIKTKRSRMPGRKRSMPEYFIYLHPDIPYQDSIQLDKGIR